MRIIIGLSTQVCRSLSTWCRTVTFGHQLLVFAEHLTSFQVPQPQRRSLTMCCAASLTHRPPSHPCTSLLSSTRRMCASKLQRPLPGASQSGRPAVMQLSQARSSAMLTHGTDPWSQRRYKAGKPLSVLDGVPFAVKDLMDALPCPTGGGTAYLATQCVTPAALPCKKPLSPTCLLPRRARHHAW